MTQEEQNHQQIGIQAKTPTFTHCQIHIAGENINNSPSHNPEQERDYDQQTLLKRVHCFWIKDFLEPSLKGSTFIQLGLDKRSDLTKNYWTSIAQGAKQAGACLGQQVSSITQAYDETDGLLILGEPGSGKTTLLLHLASA
jgi:predicted NACHT family NTPase